MYTGIGRKRNLVIAIWLFLLDEFAPENKNIGVTSWRLTRRWSNSGLDRTAAYPYILLL